MGPERPNKVWSSDGVPEPSKRKPATPPATGKIHVRIEKQGRGGKVVTVVENVPGHPAAIEALAKRLKASCGAGGTVKGRTIEIQGDHRERILALLG